MPDSLRIANGTVVSSTASVRADVLVEGGRIARLLPRGEPTPGVGRIVDATDRLVLPGGIDVHTHLDLPVGDFSSSDDFETGTIAAACGGTTCIIDYATQDRGERLGTALDRWQRKAEGRAVIDYGFHMVVVDLTDDVEREMDAIVAAGVPSFKVFMAYPGRLQIDDGAIVRVLRRTARNGGLTCLHAENGAVIEMLVQEALAAGRVEPRIHALTRPPALEAEATTRGIALAAFADAPLYVVHVSAAGAAHAIADARARGQQVFGETCPQYLALTAEAYEEPGFDGAKYVMSPPLRSRADQEVLWGALGRGEIQTVATDHCPFNMAGQKDRGRHDFSRIPNGAPGIETRLALLYDLGVRSGRLTINRFVDLTSAQPAKLFGLYPRKGAIEAGADADLVVWNPSRAQTLSASTLHMRVDYNPYEGRTVVGAPEMVIAGGEVIVEDGRFAGRPGAGRFLPRERRG
ncbi:MAG: dihydropyrimidinase [Acidobacteria bacterium]|nr:dihydropyrimidinase [Acidobacteriota bacterium]